MPRGSKWRRGDGGSAMGGKARKKRQQGCAVASAHIPQPEVPSPQPSPARGRGVVWDKRIAPDSRRVRGRGEFGDAFEEREKRTAFRETNWI
jgi:hypothetical protein